MSKEVKRHLVTAGSECSEMVYASDYDALLAERDRLREDAERYRWLIDSGNDTYSMFVEAEDKASLDAAIDAALQGEQP